ncbi:MAG TPA: HAMP domain-containing protein, partial [Thermomicrobiales bacterium]
MQQRFAPYLKALQNWRVATKLLVATALVMVFLTAVIDLLVVRQVQTALQGQAVTDVTGSTNFLKYLLDQRGAPNVDSTGVLAFGATSADEPSAVDAVKRSTRAESAIYQVVNGQVVQRANTFQTGDGGRMGGLTLDGPAAAAILRGEDYTGQLTIFGQPYTANYLVITDSANKPLGAFFTGKSATFINQQTAQITGAVTVVSILLLAGSIALLFFLVTRLMSRPLKELDLAAGQIAAGNYDVRMPIHNDDELGQVAQAVNAMVDQIVAGAREQEGQNQALQRQIVRLLDEVSSVAEGD